MSILSQKYKDYQFIQGTSEQGTSDDLINRQAVQDYIAKYLSQYLYEDVRQAVEVIDEFIGELPPVNPQEPKTGHWIEQEGRNPHCSVCGGMSYKYNFCPCCGARMVVRGK